MAGVDEAGRGSLAGPLVVAGVLLDYECLRDHRVRPLALLNDSKQLTQAERQELFRAVVGVRGEDRRADVLGARDRPQRVAPLQSRGHAFVPRRALHRPRRSASSTGSASGPSAPPHRAIVDGDTKSAAIAAASIVAKVVRDRAMRRMDAVFPHYGFSSHVGYITPNHSAAVRARGPSHIHRRSFQALCYGDRAETGVGAAS